RREAVLEDHHLEVVERHLGTSARTTGAQGAKIRGQESAVVARGRVGDPLVAQDVEAKLRHGPSFARCARKRAGSGRPGARARCGSGHRPARARPSAPCRPEAPGRGQDAAERALSRIPTSATSTSTPAPRIASSSDGFERESVISVCTRAAGTVWHIVSWPILV